MHFYSPNDVPLRRGDLVCRQSRLTKALGVGVVAGLPLFALWAARRGGLHSHGANLPGGLAYYIAATLGLFTLFFAAPLRASFHPANWILRVSDSGLIIKYRSYLNRHFPVADLQAVGFMFSEIAWARKVKETRTKPGSQNGTTTEFLTYLELRLTNPDTTALEEQLQIERNRQGSKHGLGSTTWHDYPITVSPDGIVRIHWNGITPSAAKTLTLLSHSIKIESPVKSKLDLTHLNGVSPADQTATILQLAKSGDEFAAQRLARQLYGYSITEAHDYVKNLLNKKG